MVDTMLTLNSFKTWMDRYGKASEDSDPKGAAELFTQNAVYYETPFDDPMIGHNTIYRYWGEAAQYLKDVQFSYEILAVAGNLGIALWQAKFVSVKSGNHVALDGVFLVEFDEQGKCSRFREWWHRQVVEAGANEV